MNRYPLSNQSQYQYSSGDTQSPRRRPPRPPSPLLLPLPPLGEGRRFGGIDDVQYPSQLRLPGLLGRSESADDIEQREHLVSDSLPACMPRRESLLRHLLLLLHLPLLLFSLPPLLLLLFLLFEGAVQEEGQSCGVESFVGRELRCGQQRELTTRRWRPQPSERAVREALHLQHPGSRRLSP